MSNNSPIYRNFTQQELNREYSPSSCVDDIMVYIQEYIDQSQHALETARGNQSVMEDLSFGKTDAECLDLFLPTSNSSGKLQIYIHGGYWQELSKKESSFAANYFQQQGHHFAVVNYALAPNVNLTEIVEQNRRAIAWLYLNAKELGFNREQLYISGSSAGGHLVLMLLATDWREYGIVDTPSSDVIKGACAVSAVVDLEPISLTYVNDPLQLTQTEIEQLSPLKLTFKTNADIALSYGDNETLEFKRHTEEMKAVLLEQGYQVTCKEVTGRNHFNVITDLGKADTWLSQKVLAQMSD